MRHDGSGGVQIHPNGRVCVCMCVCVYTIQSVGKQWYSWSPFEDLPFRFSLAGARRYLAHYHQLQVSVACVCMCVCVCVCESVCVYSQPCAYVSTKHCHMFESQVRMLQCHV